MHMPNEPVKTKQEERYAEAQSAYNELREYTLTPFI